MTFFKALNALFVYDLLNTFCSFETMYWIVRRWRVSRTPADENTLERVCSAVNRACIWYPKQVLCLQRSAITTYLLRGCGVPAELVLGAQKMPFKAHAWVEVAGQVLNEKTDVKAIYQIWDRC